MTDWKNFASSDPTLTDTRWLRRFTKFNIGIATGQGLLVLDFDVKDDRGGDASLDMLDVFGLPTSFRVATPSGGTHVYLSVPIDTDFTVGVECVPDYLGMDIRCNGGLVVGPGSTIGDASYTIVADHPIAEAPQWLIDQIKHFTPTKRDKIDAPATELDTDRAFNRAVDYLQNHAPEAIEGAGGDQTTYEVAARVKDFGVSESVCLDLMAEHWNEAGKASPPWPPEDLERKVANAYAYGTGRIGQVSGLAEFDDISDFLEAPKTPRKGLYRVPFAEGADLALKTLGNPLIEGLLDRQSLAMIYGVSGSGKTFVTLDLAYHIAAGRPWQGRDTSPGHVLYIAAEGGRGIFKRLAALKAHYGIIAPLDVVPCPINLLSSKADTKALINLVREAEADYRQPPRLIVVDTLSRALAGGNENAPDDMGALIMNLDRIREITRTTVAIVHHSGKDQAKGARGWSGVRAATDTEIEIVENTIHVSKQRDMDMIRDLKFQLAAVPLGKDAKGRPVSSCVVEIVTGTEFMKIELDGAALEMWEAFEDAAKAKVLARDGDPNDASEGWTVEPVTTAEWEAEFISARQKRIPDKKPPTPRYVRQIRSQVVESGYVGRSKQNEWLAEP